ncbi:gephyrin-like molybdotransferase Glp [Coprothermobacter platensis]|uniref:molybdopterin molybdotransferase MoeA n=1 Tax=Coprothermobacter platensis TaxID=108819 RepID=UPI00036CE966|nr:gephyrin-like molybdotransferase Glp [Coprothermobacter platensis]
MAFLNLFDQGKIKQIAEQLPHPCIEKQKRSVLDALGYVLAEDVICEEDIPPKARSEVDGYAVRSRDVKGASVERPSLLTKVGTIAVDEVPTFTLLPGECAYIPTGAILPQDADAVVMIEHAEESGNFVEVFKTVAPLENVISPGEDMKNGDAVLKQGDVIDAAAVGLLSYLGKTDVSVYAPLRVYVAATGNEIVEPSEAAPLGRYHDANSFSVTALLNDHGFLATRGPIIPDDITLLKQTLKEASEHFNAVVFTGGSSAGVRDLVVNALRDEGGTLIAHGFTIKPGKPTIIGSMGSSVFIGLPGHPMSCYVSASLILLPLLRSLRNEEIKPLPLLKARLRTSVFSKIGVEEWIPMKLDFDHASAELWVEPVFSKSAMVSSLVRNDGFLRVPPEKEGLEMGELVEVLLL